MNTAGDRDRHPKPEDTEHYLTEGAMCCPRCTGVLGKRGHGRVRTVRGLDEATVTVRPRRLRCRDCRAMIRSRWRSRHHADCWSPALRASGRALVTLAFANDRRRDGRISAPPRRAAVACTYETGPGERSG